MLCRLCLLVLFFIFPLSLFSQTNFDIYKSWDFENNSLGPYTDEQIAADFKYTELYSHNSANIVVDTINHVATRVMRITHPANQISNGFEMNIDLQKDFGEVYVSYDWKFSKEFNSTGGGKLPGLGGLPDFGAQVPTSGMGFRAHNLFKYAGRMASYHYDRTMTYAPWGTDEDSVYMTNGIWYNITQRLVLNTFTNGKPNADGIKEVWINGRLVIREVNLVLMQDDRADMKIDAFRLTNFYGGAEDIYKPKTECYGYIDNIKVYTPLDDPTFNTHRAHSANPIRTPDEISDRKFCYDKKITTAGVLSNSEYGTSYSSCIDETYLIDAGEGNIAKYTFDYSIGGGDYLFFYDGNTSDSKLMKRLTGSTSGTALQIKSTGRYMFVRFSSNTDGGTTGFKGNVAFEKASGTTSPSTNHAPVIYDQQFNIKENEFSENYVGNILSSDPDAGQAVKYSIVSGNESGLFLLDATTGKLTTTTSDLFEFDLTEYSLVVKVTDNASTPLSSTANVKISFMKFSQNIYIDPDHKNDPLANGSEDHPYDSWNDVSWKSGYNYLQKRSTVAVVDHILIGADRVTLDAYGEGDAPVIESNTDAYIIYCYEKSDISVRNFNIASSNAYAGIYILGSTSDNIMIEHCSIRGAGNGIRIVDGKRFIIRYNTISSGEEGVSTTASLNEIYYNIITNSPFGINLSGSSSKGNIFNNVFYNNQHAVSSDDGELTLYNNIFYMTASDQKAVMQQSEKIISDCNIFYPEQPGFIVVNSITYDHLDDLKNGLGIDNHSYINDPLFTDIYAGDFKLDGLSPAVNAGHNLNIQNDFFGQEVPSGGIPDIGVAEYLGKIPASKYSPQMNIYPNPSAGPVNIDITYPDNWESTDAHLEIFDMQGHSIISDPISANEINPHRMIDFSAFSDGVYMVIFQMARSVINQKVILRK
jgi:hypothetical protein